MKSVVYRIESENGDDQFKLPADQTQPQVEKLLKEDKLVTVEHDDGSTELLAKKDQPADWQDVFGKKAPKVEEEDEEDDDEEDSKSHIPPQKSLPQKATPRPKNQQPILSEAEIKQNEWAKKFKEVKSVTATKKQQGG